MAGISEKMAHAIKGLDLGMLRECLPLKPLVIVDSLSYLVHQKDIADVRRTMEAVRQDVRSSGAIVVQLIEDDLLSTEMKAVTGFLSDGIIRFLIRDVPDGVTRFIRIEKWMSGSSYERNIYYNYLEGEINVDLRYRVV